MKFYLIIPQERVGALLGKGKRTLKEIMERTKTKIQVEEGGRVVIEPTEETTPIMMMKAREIVRAIGLGFPPEKALSLLSDDMILEVIDVKDYLLDHHDEKTLRRLLGRVIGKGGRAKKNIEEIAGVYLSITKGQIAIIGDYESAEAAKRAIGELLEGKMHATVYRHLETAMRSIKRRGMMSYWEEGSLPF
ncbi:RNA-processing protein [Ignicoccus pacificus DSM 13166]|uniref:RNA-processing protein n=1 Tax=Ignicoccus pacificus DSM 13166 TaxID=940294 RepID=A0A977KA77_9CREN|nr:RNA-processing protein [Ignicoccus pacificus DSM 13166]